MTCLDVVFGIYSVISMIWYRVLICGSFQSFFQIVLLFLSFIFWYFHYLDYFACNYSTVSGLSGVVFLFIGWLVGWLVGFSVFSPMFFILQVFIVIPSNSDSLVRCVSVQFLISSSKAFCISVRAVWFLFIFVVVLSVALLFDSLLEFPNLCLHCSSVLTYWLLYPQSLSILIQVVLYPPSDNPNISAMSGSYACSVTSNGAFCH